MKISLFFVGLALFCFSATAQTSPLDGKKDSKTTTPSTSLTVKGLHGQSHTYSVEEVKKMTHMILTVHNPYTDKDEEQSGVPVSEFLKRAVPQLILDETMKPSPLMMVLIFEGTDKYRVVLTECDVDPRCHNGVVMVVDQVNGNPLTSDGAFKLLSTEDKKPRRWVRNLSSITIQEVR